MRQSEKFHSTGRNPFELTLANLPAPDTRRWNTVRKVFVVRAIQVGVLSFDQASKRYRLSAEEFMSWHKLAADFGNAVSTPWLSVAASKTAQPV